MFSVFKAFDIKAVLSLARSVVSVLNLVLHCSHLNRILGALSGS